MPHVMINKRLSKNNLLTDVGCVQPVVKRAGCTPGYIVSCRLSIIYKDVRCLSCLSESRMYTFFKNLHLRISFLESIGYLCRQIRCHNMESDMPPPARGTPSKRAGGHRNIMTPDLSAEVSYRFQERDSQVKIRGKGVHPALEETQQTPTVSIYN